jgi:hypothetical protein
MNAGGRKYPGKCAAVDNNRDPEGDPEGWLLSFVAKQALSDQRA